MKKIVFLMVLGVSLSSVAMKTPRDFNHIYLIEDCSRLNYISPPSTYEECILRNETREAHNEAVRERRDKARTNRHQRIDDV